MIDTKLFYPYLRFMHLAHGCNQNLQFPCSEMHTGGRVHCPSTVGNCSAGWSVSPSSPLIWARYWFCHKCFLFTFRGTSASFSFISHLQGGSFPSRQKFPNYLNLPWFFSVYFNPFGWGIFLEPLTPCNSLRNILKLLEPLLLNLG